MSSVTIEEVDVYFECPECGEEMWLTDESQEELKQMGSITRTCRDCDEEVKINLKEKSITKEAKTYLPADMHILGEETELEKLEEITSTANHKEFLEENNWKKFAEENE